MDEVDDTLLLKLHYDQQTENAEFGFGGHRDGRMLSVSGIVPVSHGRDMTEVQIEEACRQAVRKLLRDLADTL